MTLKIKLSFGKTAQNRQIVKLGLKKSGVQRT